MVRMLLLLPLLAYPEGCLRSRWAMDDPIYAEKYADGASKLDVPGKLKQAVDARHLAGHHGWYTAAGYQSEPSAVAAELGIFGYPSSWATVRGGLMGVADEVGEDAFVGGNVGVRAHSPSRIAPFVGAGMFNGISWRYDYEPADGTDNDNNGVTDDEGDYEIDGWRTSVYPELGLHAWLTSRLRLTGSVAYHITTEGRDHDYWLTGLELSWLSANSRGWAEPYDPAQY